MRKTLALPNPEYGRMQARSCSCNCSGVKNKLHLKLSVGIGEFLYLRIDICESIQLRPSFRTILILILILSLLIAVSQRCTSYLNPPFD